MNLINSSISIIKIKIHLSISLPINLIRNTSTNQLLSLTSNQCIQFIRSKIQYLKHPEERKKNSPSNWTWSSFLFHTIKKKKQQHWIDIFVEPSNRWFGRWKIFSFGYTHTHTLETGTGTHNNIYWMD